MRNLLSILVVLVAGAAAADDIVKPNGIKIGEGRLHPFLSVRALYDTAAGYFGSNALTGDLIVTPSAGLRFDLATDATTINFNGSGGYAIYTGLHTRESRDLSYITAAVGLDTAFNRNGAVEFQIGDRFANSNRTSAVVAALNVLGLYNSAYIAAPIHPGGGAISVTPKVRWDVEFFMPQLSTRDIADCDPGDIRCDPEAVNRMNYSNLNFGLGAKWKFLPKTAAVFDASFDYRAYLNTSAPTSGVPNTSTNLNAMLFKAMAGMLGLITTHISTTVMVGGGGDFGGSGAANFLAQAEIAYLSSDFTARAGYVRGLTPVPVYGIFAQDRGYAEVKATFFGRLTTRGYASYDYIAYQTRLVAETRDRFDQIITGGAELTYQFLSFFSASAQCNASYRWSNIEAAGLNFLRIEPSILLTLSY